ncbi:hypothetical protein [Bradyrhizobium sp.]|uniref:hypothetical protein n=1 Tax=Bradyrhizobium sp. TaxID=376 RepID=UPI003C79555F
MTKPSLAGRWSNDFGNDRCLKKSRCANVEVCHWSTSLRKYDRVPRMSLQLDAVDANAFDGVAGSIENRKALLLARISTTPNRLEQLFFQIGKI